MRIKRIHRFISLVLILTFCLSFAMLNVEAKQDVNDTVEYVASDEFIFVRTFDLMPVCNYDDFQPDKHITRAEFARIICAIADIEPSNHENSFVDTKTNKYHEYINSIYNYGIMVGADKFTFLPDKEITINETIKTLLVLFGYKVQAEVKGGYPIGYHTVARKLGMLDDVQNSGSSIATRGDIAQILYNCADIELMSVVAIGEDYTIYDTFEEETFMTVYLGIDRISGVMQDNGITALRDESIGAGRIVIDGKTFKTDDIYNARKYIGRYVDVYYEHSDSVLPTVKYITLDSSMKDSEIRFDIKDFISLSSNTISYDDNGKIESLNIKADTNIIYNNKATKQLTTKMFDYDYGTVIYVPDDGDNDATLIIEGFVSWYIESVDRDLEFVRTGTMSPKIDDSYVLYFPESEIGSTIFIEDEYGFPAAFNDIARYCVLDICKNEEIMYVKIAPMETSDRQISSIEKDNYETRITFSDGTIMFASPFYSETKDFNAVQPGNIYYVYKNSFGQVVALVVVDSATYEIGYLLGAATGGGFSDERQIKVITTADKIEILDVDEKIMWSDEKNNTKKCKFSDILQKLSTYEGPINYKKNTEGLVTLIYLPVELGLERDIGRLGCIYDGVLGWKEDDMKNYGTKILCQPSVKTFLVYEQETNEEEKYRCQSANEAGFDSENDNMKAYNYEPNSLFAEFLSGKCSSTSDNTVAIPSSGNLIMIQKMSQTIYKDELYTKINAYNFATFKDEVLYVEQEKLSGIWDTMNYKSDYTLCEGDLILCTFEPADRNILRSARILWRSDMDNVIYGPEGRRGGIAGGLGYFDPDNTSRSNPYIMYSDANAVAYITAENKVWNGYAYYVDSKGGLIISTKDLSNGSIDDGWDDEKHNMAALISDSGKYGFVTFKDNKIVCREGSINDIRTYLNDGNNASRIISIMSFGRSERVIIINGEMDW